MDDMMSFESVKNQTLSDVTDHEIPFTTK